MWSSSSDNIKGGSHSSMSCRSHRINGNVRNRNSPSCNAPPPSPRQVSYDNADKPKHFKAYRPPEINVYRAPETVPSSLPSKESPRNRKNSRLSILDCVLMSTMLCFILIGVFSIFELVQKDDGMLSSSLPSFAMSKNVEKLTRQLQDSLKHLKKLETNQKVLHDKLIREQEIGANARQLIQKSNDEKKSEPQLVSHLQNLQMEVEELAKGNVLNRFGVGPYFVQIDLKLPTSLFPDTNDSSIILQMAPLENQPEAIYTFLSQVIDQVWTNNNAVIYRNAHHLLQVQVDASALIERMPFQELAHTNFQHEMYTVGYSGHGITWFINLNPENVKLHANLPCFAKISKGSELVWKIHETMQTIHDPDNHDYLVEPIQIGNVFIVPQTNTDVMQPSSS